MAEVGKKEGTMWGEIHLRRVLVLNMSIHFVKNAWWDGEQLRWDLVVLVDNKWEGWRGCGWMVPRSFGT